MKNICLRLAPTTRQAASTKESLTYKNLCTTRRKLSRFDGNVCVAVTKISTPPICILSDLFSPPLILTSSSQVVLAQQQNLLL